jgi:hypothetical protein
MGKLDGHCLCGSISYSCEEEPLFTAICHCKNCQRQTGTSFSIVVGVPDDALKIEGDTLGTIVTHGEEHPDQDSRRSFCSACGSPIVTRSEAMAGVAIVKAGTLDDATWLQPQVEVWGNSAQPWVEIDETRPRMPTGPPRA